MAHLGTVWRSVSRGSAHLALPPGQPVASYAPDFRAQLEMLIELRVPVAGFTFGLLLAADVERLHASGSDVVGTATHVAEGIAWLDAGADAIAAQGAEAGGIMDGRGIAAALAPGAQAAMIGTAFPSSQESAIPEVWKTRVRGTRPIRRPR